VPEDSESVTEAVLNALFLPGRKTSDNQLQLDFGFEAPQVTALHSRWELDAERERINRTRFAQRALRPDEVRKELEATDAVLGDPDAVRAFVLSAAQRLGLAISRDKRSDVYRVAIGPEAIATLPTTRTYALPAGENGQWRISFTSPTPEAAEYVGRNHRFVAALARFLMEEALTRHGQATASRCGVIRTRAVSRLTTVALLRVRYLLHQPERAPLLSEEVLVAAYTTGASGTPEWLDDAEALRLLAEARPDANVPMAEKRSLVADVLEAWPKHETALRQRIDTRTTELASSHKRVRQAVSLPRTPVHL
jgi:hypothetical protein